MKKEHEEIDCPYCDGAGLLPGEPDDDNNPIPVQCLACDLTGRVTTKSLKLFLATQEILSNMDNEGLPF